MLYPRDPSLDPQLVWKGKDEQDRQDLEVPVVPIYIQEKIHPQAHHRGPARHARRPASRSQQLDLFADFNGLDDFDKKVEFYQHDQHWSNRMILGDSLLVMTSLAEKEGLKGKVQSIYFDPPYGIKFGSNWQVSTRKRDVKDGKAEDADAPAGADPAFRDTWELGIHSYLRYLRDRLVVARDLLTETGSIFVQIGDENVHLVRCVLDEVFGSENFCSLITFAKTTGARRRTSCRASTTIVLWYAKRHATRRSTGSCISTKELGDEVATDIRSGRTAGRHSSRDDRRRRRLRRSMPERVAALPARQSDIAERPRRRTRLFPIEFEGERLPARQR